MRRESVRVLALPVSAQRTHSEVDAARVNTVTVNGRAGYRPDVLACGQGGRAKADGNIARGVRLEAFKLSAPLWSRCPHGDPVARKTMLPRTTTRPFAAQLWSGPMECR